MTLEYLILLLYIIPVLMCVQSFQKIADSYAQLPEKIPVHFNLRGQADQWLKKGRVSVYMMPVIALIVLLSSILMLAFIYNDTGALPDDFAFAYWFFTFSITYLLCKTQDGIIQYSLKKIDSIWSEISNAFVMLIGSSVLFVVLIINPVKPEIAEAVICANVIDHKPVDIRTDYTKNDEKVTLFLELMNVRGKHDIRAVWIDPTGKDYFIYDRSTHHKIITKRQTWWSFIYLQRYKKKIRLGNWSVNIYIDGEKILTKSFNVTR